MLLFYFIFFWLRGLVVFKHFSFWQDLFKIFPNKNIFRNLVWVFPALSYSKVQNIFQTLEKHIWKRNRTSGFPVLHHLPELAQTHVPWVGDAIQPSHPHMEHKLMRGCVSQWPWELLTVWTAAPCVLGLPTGHLPGSSTHCMVGQHCCAHFSGGRDWGSERLHRLPRGMPTRENIGFTPRSLNSWVWTCITSVGVNKSFGGHACESQVDGISLKNVWRYEKEVPLQLRE